MKDYRLKVIVNDNGGGWYRFSPSGHGGYSNRDEIKVQGLQKCIRLLNDYNLKGYLNNQQALN